MKQSVAELAESPRTAKIDSMKASFLAILLELCTTAAAHTGSNLREFYLQLGGIGPTSGESISGTGTQWLLQTSWASQILSVCANWNVEATQISEARGLGWSVTLTTHGSPRWRARTHATQSPPQPIENLTMAMAAQSAAGLEGAEVLMEYICEDDSAGVGFPQDLLARARSASYTNGATRLRPEEAMEAWKEYVHEAHEAIAPWPLARRNARVGWPSSTHSVAPFADSILVELTNDDTGTLAPALPFLRGAARQYNISWGVDLSLWWGVIDGCVQDLPASLHRRVMALSYIAGASVISVEGCGWVDGSTGQPNAMAREVDRFGNLVVSAVVSARKAAGSGAAKGGLPPSQRGLSDATVALVLPPDLGWTERPSWSNASPTLWSYANLPASSRRGAAAVDGLLSAAYPGANAFGFLAFPLGKYASEPPTASPFARSAVAPPYAPDPFDEYFTDPNLPFGAFHDRDALHQWFRQSGGVDPAPYRPMADSRWGDLLDVLVADTNGRWATTLSTLQASGSGYQVVVWANSSTSPEARDALIAFAERGGTVVLAVGTVGPSDVSLTGATPSGELRAVRAWQWINVPKEDRRTTHRSTRAAESVSVDHFLTATANLTATSTLLETLAVSVPEQLPLVVRRRLGQGAVYTCLVPWLGADKLSPPALRLLDSILTPLQPVAITEGLPALYWTSALLKKGSGRVAAISNNADARWVGKVAVRLGDTTATASASAACVPSCEDVWTGDAIACNLVLGSDTVKTDAVEIELTIEANDVALIKASCASPKSREGNERNVQDVGQW